MPLNSVVAEIVVPSEFLNEVDEQQATDGDQLYEQSEAAIQRGDLDEALQLVIEAEALFEEEGDDEKIAKAFIRRANILHNQQHIHIAIEVLKEALERFLATSRLPIIHYLLGNFYLNIDTLKSVEAYNAALQTIERLPDDELNHIRLRTHHNLALSYSNIGQRELAYQHYLETINYAEAEGDTIVLTTTYNNLGMAYGQDEDYGRSRYYLEQALQLARQRNSHIDMYRAYINLGNIYNNTGDYESALDSFNSALEALNEFDPDNPSEILTHNIGRTLSKMKRYDEAEIHLLQALEIAEDRHPSTAIFRSSLILGTMYGEMGRTEDALEYLTTAEEHAADLTNAYLKLEVNQALHEFYAKENRYQLAYEQLQQYAVLADSLAEARRGEELTNAENYLELKRQYDINELLVQSQTEQENRINNQRILLIIGFVAFLLLMALLEQVRRLSQKKIPILKQVEQQKKELEVINSSKDKLFAIISHDLRGTLSSMQGILTLIKSNMLTDEDFRELIPLLEASVQENLNVMEDLLAWAQGQISEVKLHFEPIDIAKLLKEVILSQKYIADKKNIDINLAPVEPVSAMADYNAMKLILRNLISNAIKFSYKNKPIMIAVSQRDKFVVIEIRDLGIGIPEEMKSNIFDNNNWTRAGTDNEKGTGFGLRLSHEFVERMDGRIHFTSKEGKGSSFFVEIPRHEVEMG